MSKSPTVTITLDKPYTIEFDLACIQRIEDVTQRGCFDLAQNIFEVFAEFPKPTPQDPNPKPSAKQALAAMRHVRAGEALKFIAACIDRKVEEASKIVPKKALLETYFQLGASFAESIQELGGGDEEGGAEGKEKPQVSGSDN